MFELAYNSSKHATTGVEPFYMVYGDVPPAPFSLVNTAKVRSKDGSDLAGILVNVSIAPQDALQETARKYRELHERVRRGHSYEVGDSVLLSSKNLSLRGACRKLSPKFVGPFTIIAAQGINNVVLERSSRFQYIDPVVHIERLRPYKASPVQEGELPDAITSGPGLIMDDPRGGSWWEVEDVVAHMGPLSRRRYLVRISASPPHSMSGSLHRT